MKKTEVAGHVVRVTFMTFEVLTGKPFVRRPLGSHKRRMHILLNNLIER